MSEMSEGEITSSLLDGSTPRISLHSIKQLIHLAGDDRTSSISVYGNQVEIVTGQSALASSTATASNKIKINPMVNYDWDMKYYRGSLIALGSKFIAYTLKGRNGYVVRLLNPETATRALIKGFIGLVTDLAFAHANSNTLACVDEGGNVYVWSVQEEDGKIEYNLKLRVNRSPHPTSEYHRVIWSPYLPEEGEVDVDEMEEDERPLAVTHHNQAEVIDIPMVIARCGCNEVTEGMLQEGEGYILISEGHTKPITDASLSPDGAVLATGSEDGYVRFWSVGDMLPDSAPSCLHEYQPHEGSPVSLLTFCDNHTVQEKDVPMWRFMVTGAEYNREIKIWCTVTWTCIQTLRFTSPTADIANVLGESYFKARLDATAKYLVFSDIGRKVLYILLVHQDREAGRAHISSITDFQLTQPLLSFMITKAKLFKTKQDVNQHLQNGEGSNGHDMNGDDVHDEGMEELLDESELEFEERRKNLLVQLRLYSIHTKSLQELLVHFQPEPSIPPPTPSNMSSIVTSIGLGVKDGLSDLSGMETGTEASTDVDESDPGPPDTPGSSHHKLITPDAFTKGSSRPESMTSSITTVSALPNASGVDMPLDGSVSSNLSDTTVKSSLAESLRDTPRSSFSDNRVLTPTSLPLPPTPPSQPPPEVPTSQAHPDKRSLSPTSLPIPDTPLLSAAPDASMVPIPKFQSLLDDQTNSEDDIAGLSSEISNNKKEEGGGLEGTTQRQSVSSSTSSTPKEPIPIKEVLAMDSSSSEGAVKLEDRRHRNASEESEEATEAWSTPIAQTRTITDIQKSKPKHNLITSPATARVDIPPDSTSAVRPEDPSILQLIELIQQQHSEISRLRAELKESQEQHRYEVTRLLQGEIGRLEDTVTERLREALAHHSLEENQRLEKALRDKQSQDKKRHEQLTSTLSQSVTNALTGKLEKTVKQEVKGSVVPAVQKAMVPVQDQLNTTIAQKLTAADAVFKDSVGKMMKSKAVIDSIGSSAAAALQGPIQGSYREAFQSTILPAFERSCHSMFQQINDAFHRGTQQYLERVTATLENQRREQQEARDPVVQQLQAQVQSFQSESQRLRNTMTTMTSEMTSEMEVLLQKQLASSMHSLREELVSKLETQVTSNIQQVIQEEIRLGMQDLGPRYQPDPPAKMGTRHDYEQIQRRIQVCLSEGQVAMAFQEALTAADLSLVTMVCESVDVNELFSQTEPLPLSQPVLLSLIQQLSVDLLTNTQLKHRYLEEAVMALDTTNEVTSEHMPAVIQGLVEQLTIAIPQCSGPTQRSLRMLLMAAQSLTSR
ncbi:enhancer of mRNA-decapping protein 4 isoform X2 [Nematostella vectensis]|nr:enhancer of mRNA-decapping protein 4 isoform X2 [Nematostella vectensis]